jgi:tetratricopeptide (TPR) repeat protein
LSAEALNGQTVKQTHKEIYMTDDELKEQMDRAISATRELHTSSLQESRAQHQAMLEAQRQSGLEMRRTAEQGFDQLGTTLHSGFNRLDSRIGDAVNAVGIMAYAICNNLNAIHQSLSDMELTQAQGLTRRAAENLANGFYMEAREEIMRALNMHKTNPLSWYLLGATYLPKKPSAECRLEYDKAIEALSRASKYIAPYAGKDADAKKFAAQIEWTLGLTRRKQFDALRAAGKTAEARQLLQDARQAFDQSAAYSGRS